MSRTPKKIHKVPVAWESLEDAFENNAPEVHSYLHLESGEVVRIVDGIADPTMHGRIVQDPKYLRIDPVSSREQYRWMERFIDTVDPGELRDRLGAAIDGKGAFRRFKDVLMSFPVDRERWFAFRSERLRSCMQAWLEAHDIEVVARPEWHVPTAEDVQEQVAAQEVGRGGARRTRAEIAETHRARLRELTDLLPARELDAAVAFLEFLRERKHLPRPQAKAGRAEVNTDGAEGVSSASDDDGGDDQDDGDVEDASDLEDASDA